MSASPEKALQSSGILTKSEQLKQIINGVKTIAPVITALIREDRLSEPESFKSLLAQTRELQLLLLKHATDAGFEITPQHYVSLNRLSLHIVCSSEYRQSEGQLDNIAMWCCELFDQDDIHAESMLEEFSDNDFALQFVAVSCVASTITKFLVKSALLDDSDDVFAELMQHTIECVDKHIDEIYDDFIEPSCAVDIRSHLIQQASTILDATLCKHLEKYPSPRVNTALINKRFEIAYSTYVEAVTLSSKIRS